MGSETYKVLFFAQADGVEAIYRRYLPAGWEFESLEDRGDEAEKLRRIGDADFVVHSDQPITAEHLDAATRLKLVTRQGVGLDLLDVALVKSRGLPVCICPVGTDAAVAEHTVMLMLAVARNLIQLHEDVRLRGEWPRWRYRMSSAGFVGRRVGIVGWGGIGQAVASRMLAFESEILVYLRPGRSLSPHWQAQGVVATHSLDEVFAESDVVSLHLPLRDDTRGLVDLRLLRLMKPDAIFINTARGGLVVEDDLVQVARDRSIAGIGLDVLSDEPPRPDHPLFAFDNVLITPHVGAGTRQTQEVKVRELYANMQRVADGEEPLYQVG